MPACLPICRDNAAKIFGVLSDTPWAAHAKLVLVTAEGHRAPAMNHDIFQPWLPTRLETWADFSARLPSAQASICPVVCCSMCAAGGVAAAQPVHVPAAGGHCCVRS
jgi:hypothetical protein